MQYRIPKGRLLVIGGAEDKGNHDEEEERKRKNRDFRPYEILGELLPLGNRKKHGIEVITTASEIPEEVGGTYIETFKRTGFTDVDFMNIGNKEDAADETFIRRVKSAHAVLFSGGDQFRLATILGGTRIMEAIHDRYMDDGDFILAGTSAGAMAMPQLMLFFGDNNAMLKGDVKISSGLGLMDHCIIDTHFMKRGRFGRLAQAVLMNPTCTGLGLGEDTALIISKGNEAECRGSGMVVVIDGREIGHTNIAYAEEETPLCVENLKVHILKKGNGFLLRERRFVASKADLERERIIKK